MSKLHALAACMTAALVSLSAGSTGPALPASLLKDIRSVADLAPDFSPGLITTAGSAAYFTNSLGDGLWKTDGTAAGTALVANLHMVNNLRKVGGAVFFDADDGVHGTELWKSDGTTAGTAMVIDFTPGFDGTNLIVQADFLGYGWFVAAGGIWRTDGTAAGTVEVKDLSSLGDSNIAVSIGGPFTVVGPLMYFSARDSAAVVHLFRTDGTTAGTFQVSAASVDGASPAYAAGSLLYFGGIESSVPGLYVSDGTLAGTHRVSTSVRPNLTAVGACDRYDAGTGTLYFSGISTSLGTGLWKTDGTDAGTVLIKDFNPSSSDYYFYAPQECRYIGNLLYFRVETPAYGGELWVSDGTTGGTTLVKDINTTYPYFASPMGFAVVGSTLYFTAFDGSVNALWQSDGTSAGTVSVAPLGGLSFLVSLGNTLLFANTTATNGTELWKSDGTSVGTALLKDLANQPGSTPGKPVYLNGFAYFAADDKVSGRELWKTDGTAGGTTLVKDINTGAGGSSPDSLAVMGAQVYFAATDASGDRELWRSDGTSAGTVRVHDVHAGAGGSDPRDLIALGSTLFFSADDGVNGAELWKSDGTDAGTLLLKDIVAGSGSGLSEYSVQHFFALGSTLLFYVPDRSELWKSDGTTAGTVVLDALAVPRGPGPTPNGAVMNGYFYYAADDINSGIELFRTDGATRTLVKDIYAYGFNADSYPANFVVAGNTLYFDAQTDLDPPNDPQGRQLWKSDGTAAGTTLVKTTGPALAFYFASPVAIGNRIFFTAREGTQNPYALWTSDGTSAGTVLLKDIPVSEIVALPNSGRVLFSAFTPESGQELWQSDGTVAGTVLAQDIQPGIGSSSPGGFTQAGPLLMFAADDGTNGREPWLYDIGAQTVTGPLGAVTATPDKGAVENLTAVATPSAAPSTYTYPYGFYAFNVTGLTAGATVHVNLQLPSGTAPTSYVKCSGSSCSPFAGAAFSGQTVTLTLVDGGPGDADGVANGTIVDPGAPANAVSGGGSGSGGGGGGGGGGAFDGLLLAVLLAGAGLRRRRAA